MEQCNDTNAATAASDTPYVTAYAHLLNNISVLAFLALVDKVFLSPWLASRNVKSKDMCTARWFFLHSLANVAVVATSLMSMRAVLGDPLHAMDGRAYVDTSAFGNASVWPLTIIKYVTTIELEIFAPRYLCSLPWHLVASANVPCLFSRERSSVHVYHMVGGFKLSGADYFHHLVFIPTLGFPGQVYRWGPLANWQVPAVASMPPTQHAATNMLPTLCRPVRAMHRPQAFFISGLPGGIDYLLLGLVKLGILDHMVEKRMNANLNTWVRSPGILCACVLLYQAVLLDMHVVPRWALYLQSVLPAYNALYFNKQAVANYAVHYMLHLLGQDAIIKKHIEQRTSFTTGEQVMSWKDAVSVPQRGS